MKNANGDKEKKVNNEKGEKLNRLWTVVGGIASLVAIIVFLTGKDSIQGFLGKDQVEVSTMEPILEPTPMPEYLFQDDFSNSTSGWDVSTDMISERKYKDGEYIMRAGPGVSGSGESQFSGKFQDCYENWSLAGLGHISDIAIDVDARYIGGASEYGAYGIVFYYQDNIHFYYYEFFPNWGVWGMVQRNPDGYFDKLFDQNAPDFRIGQSKNHIRLEISKSLELYINGEFVSTYQVPYQTGDVGLWAVSCTDEIFEVAFDDFVVSKLP